MNQTETAIYIKSLNEDNRHDFSETSICRDMFPIFGALEEHGFFYNDTARNAYALLIGADDSALDAIGHLVYVSRKAWEKEQNKAYLDKGGFVILTQEWLDSNEGKRGELAGAGMFGAKALAEFSIRRKGSVVYAMCKGKSTKYYAPGPSRFVRLKVKP